MKIKLLYLLVLAITLFATFGWTAVYAQEVTESIATEVMESGLPETEMVSLAQLTVRREEAVTDTSLTESQKVTVLSLFDRAIQAIHTTENLKLEAGTVRARAASAPRRISELDLQLAQADKKFLITLDQFADLPAKEISTLAERARRNLEFARDEFYRNRVSIRQLSIRPEFAARCGD